MKIKRVLSKLLWHVISPFVILVAWIYFRLAPKDALVTSLFPFGLVLFLIFLTAKVEDPEGPF